MSEASFESPLAGLTPPYNLAVAMAEIVDRGMIDLRGNPQDGAFSAAAEAVLGVSLPVQPRRSVTAGDVSLLWLSVDQWLVQCPRGETGDLAVRLKQALEGITSLVVDMSDARAVIRLQGDGVREVIMKGAPLDLTASDFTAGTVRRLRFGEIAALVHIVGEQPDVIDLLVFRSYAVFAWEWLTVTAQDTSTVRLFAPQSAPIA